MIRLFRKRSEREILEIKYKSLLEESYKLSTSNRRESDLMRAKAEEVLKSIERLKEE